jgi:hypothetical protein
MGMTELITGTSLHGDLFEIAVISSNWNCPLSIVWIIFALPISMIEWGHRRILWTPAGKHGRGDHNHQRLAEKDLKCEERSECERKLLEQQPEKARLINHFF